MAQSPGVTDDQRASGDEKAVILVVLGDTMSEGGGCSGVPAECFEDDALNVGESGFVFEAGKSDAVGECVDLALSALAHFGMKGQGEKDGGDQRGGL